MTAQLDKKETKVKRSWLLRGIAVIFSLFLLVVLALQMSALGAFFWLNTASGQSWLENKLTEATKDTGYHIKAQQIYMRGFGRFLVGALEISDKDGVVLNARGIDVSVSLAQISAKNMSLSVDVKNVIVHRLPAGDDAVASTALLPLAPILLPDMYFNKINISAFNINEFVLEPAVMGEPLSLSPHLRAQVSVRDNRLLIDADAKIKNATIAYVPQSISLKAVFDTQTAQAKIEKFDVGSELYGVNAAGNAGLGADGVIDLAIHANTEKLAQLAGADFAGRVDADLKLSGKTAAPVANLQAVTRFEMAAGRGLDDIHLIAHADNLLADISGKIKLTSAYKEKPITVSTDISYGDNNLRLSNLHAAAPDATVDAVIDIDALTMLATGKVKLSSIVDTYRDLLNLNISGRGDVNLDLSAKNDRQFAQVRADIKNARYDDIHLAAATLDVSIPDILAIWPETMVLSLQSLEMPDITLSKATSNIKRISTEKYQLYLDVSGKSLNVPFTLKGSTDIAGSTIEDMALSNIDISLAPEKIGKVHVRGSALPDTIDMAFDTENISLSSLPIELPEAAKDMRLSVSGLITGLLSAPIISAEMQISSVGRRSDFPALSLALKSRYEDGKFTTDISGHGDGIRVLTGRAALPANLSLRPFVLSLPDTVPLDAMLDASLDIAPLAKFFAPAGADLDGKVVAHAQISGTSKQPIIAGEATLSNGVFSQEGSGINLRNIALQGSFDDSKLVVSSLSATDSGEGRVTGKGSISLTQTGDANIELHVKDLSPFKDSTYAKGYVSADLSLAGNAKAYMVKGSVTTNRLDINIPERFSSDIPKLNILNDKTEKSATPDILKTIGLDVTFTAENKIFVRGWGLDAEFGGALDINGTAAEPLINGNLESKRGRYEEFGKRFTLSRANLRFQGAVPPSPYLDILAETKTKDITAQVNLSGPVVKPVIALSSIPALPQDEVMSRILFNNEMSKISPWQGVQLARTLRRFSGKGGDGFDPLSEIRGATGLDDLKVEMNDEGGATVGAGKYITDKVYLQVEAGTGKKGSATKLEIELTPQIKLESRVGQDAQGGAGIFWQKDY